MAMAEHANSQFRVIIVGGGPVGLVAAHIFAAAGIGFVLLEQRDTIVPKQGAGIVLFPHTQRVFDQLGLMGPLREISHRFDSNRIVNTWGWNYSTIYTNKWTEENHGAGWLFLHRPELLQVLYDALPDTIKACLIPSKKVNDIRTVSDGVVVQCTDGTTEKGSIVVGADGVHSRVRDCMRKLALRESTRNYLGNLDTSPFVATFRCMYGNTAKISGLEPGVEWDLHGSGIAMQLFGGQDKAWFLFYEKLPGGETRERRRYSEEEVAQLAAKFKDVYVTKTLRFKDVWDAREWCMLSDLQEGIADRWHGKRIVLVGDAASKQTPNIGQGWNCGIQDVVVLVNGLRQLLDGAKGAALDAEDMEPVLGAYEEARRPDLVSCFEAAAGTTRSTTWETWPAYLRDRFLLPLTGGNKGTFRSGAGGLMSRGRVLDFIPEKNRPVGAIPWVHIAKVEAEGSEEDIGK